MNVSQLPLNALRAFEASARLGSFTKAGLELRVSQTAVSHQVKSLEAVLGISLFDRLPRGVVLTDEGQTLLPVLNDAFNRMSAALSRFEHGNFQEVLTIGVVSTFANGWLIARLKEFSQIYPDVDVRLKTNNNRADFLEDGLDYFIRFGDGAWHSTNAIPLIEAPLSPICASDLARDLKEPSDLKSLPLLRSYRHDEWSRWFQAAGVEPPAPRGWVFDSSIAMAGAAAQGVGVALVPVAMFQEELSSGQLVQPFPQSVSLGRYWLTWLKSRKETGAMRQFRDWIAVSTSID
ncbi:LysR family transcriptional regulator [Labrenzia sp. PHM005]|uniref:LysR family transcriptional regulator n=1 Tax=Labrenzia sp. PHM005 TaxID=2590016 RepID=UPI00114003D1|nr:LysR family transcriptional regulator [Labrenzia sp. PHM005]QDG79258.1 LysR family transcriptional regulator [Labrenzia sp. PHM005]